VPEVIMGVPKYDQGACIAYLIDRLQENGFNVKYIHPNTLFISWNHFVPSYVRTELKKKSGIVVNEYGVNVDEGDDQNKMITAGATATDPNNLIFKEQNNANPEKTKKNYTPINSYKPSGNLVYGDDILSSLEEKFS
jgi:hypothetical protein